MAKKLTHAEQEAYWAAKRERPPLTAGEVRANVLEEASSGLVDRREFKPGCLDSAADDEPVFVLRAQDRFAPDVVEFWCTLVQTRNGGKATPKVLGARKVMHAMREWQRYERVNPASGTRETVDRSKVPD